MSTEQDVFVSLETLFHSYKLQYQMGFQNSVHFIYNISKNNNSHTFTSSRSQLVVRNTQFISLFIYEELSDLYSLPNIVRVVKSRRKRWAEHVARMGQGRGVCRVLVGKPEGKRPLGRPGRRWEDNIKMDLQEVGGVCGDWME